MPPAAQSSPRRTPGTSGKHTKKADLRARPDPGATERLSGASEPPPPPDYRYDPAVRLPVNTRPLRPSNDEARKVEAEEDRVLVTQAKNGDLQAFRRLVERHQRRATAIALGLVRDENDAQEVVQEAFLRVYRSLATFEGSSSFFTWLYRIVHNLAIDVMRRPSRREVGLPEQASIDDGPNEPLVSRIDGSDPSDVVRRGEIRRRLEVALDALPPYHRGVILMREIEGMSYEEMATAMGVSKGTIMSRLFHARKKLQQALLDCYDEQIGAPVSSREGDSP